MLFDWHDEFRNPGYEFLKNYLKELDDIDHPYDFIRIGENIEDFEVTGRNQRGYGKRMARIIYMEKLYKNTIIIIEELCIKR